MKFKVGDKVKCIKDYDWVKIGMKGVIVYFLLSTPSIGVKWENVPEGKGHNCHGHIKEGKDGYYVNEHNIELISINKSTFMNKLTAKIKRLFKENQRLQYKAGLISDCGDLTEQGRLEREELLNADYDDKLTERAKEIIAEAKE